LPNPIPRPIDRTGALPNPIPQPIEKTSSFSRTAAIKSLLANQASRRALGSLAASAGLKPEQLTTKTLQGKSVSTVARGQGIDDLAWDAGIKISLTKDVPIFYNSAKDEHQLVGILTYENVKLCNAKSFLPTSDSSPSLTLKELMDNGIFRVSDNVELYLYLPNPGAYMISVTSMRFPVVLLSDRTGKKHLEEMVPGSIPNTWVCVTTISPWKVDSHWACKISVSPSMTPWAWSPPDWIGGFTITRL
jgi:hypothetical protein